LDSVKKVDHDLVDTLVGHSYIDILTCNENFIFVHMTKRSVKFKNILITIKEHNEMNVTTINIKQIYNSNYVYCRSDQGHKTEMQSFMMLLQLHMYVHWYKFNEGTNIVTNIF